MNKIFNNSNKTFKPNKKIEEGQKNHQLMKYAAATLGTGNLRSAVKCPPGENENEWLAVNCIDFYNQINLLYGTITEFCTPQSCPVMSAGPKFEYHWSDGVKVKTPIKCSAPEYVDYLMNWIQEQFDDESVFPSQSESQYPKNFKNTIATFFKRVYAHVYHSHIAKVASLGEEAHLNTSFKHFMFFVQEFKLVDPKECEPLKDLIASLLNK